MPEITQISNISSKHFEAIFFYAPMGIIITDESGTVAAINPFSLKEFGYSEKEVVGKKIELLVPPRFREKHSNYHKKYIENPRTRLMSADLNLFAVRKDGTEFPVEINLSNYTKGGNKYTVAFVNNISDRKKSEAEIEMLNTELEAKVEKRTADLKKTTRQLELSKDKLEEAQSFQKALFNNAGAMVIATDENGVIRFFNPEATLCIGYSESEIINKHTPLLFHDKKEIDQRRRELLREFGVNIKDDFEVMVEKSKRNIHEEEQYTYIRKDKTSFPVLLTITAIRNSEGIITGFMGIAIDITDRKKAEEKLLESLKKEKDLNELKSRFVSMASHEFRTPLSTVLSSAYLVEKYASTEDQSKREKHLRRIINSVNMLTDILNDFLSVGKIEEGKIQVRSGRFNIKETISEIAEELKDTLKAEQKIKYRHQGNEEVYMDPSLLKHIVMNLVSNASKFSSEGMPIEIKTVNADTALTLSVKDKGIGISKEDQKHLMECFFRGANAGNIQGTGLGLHIVAKYSELMDGKVKCKSELEKGTEFIITFTTKKS